MPTKLHAVSSQERTLGTYYGFNIIDDDFKFHGRLYFITLDLFEPRKSSRKDDEYAFGMFYRSFGMKDTLFELGYMHAVAQNHSMAYYPVMVLERTKPDEDISETIVPLSGDFDTPMHTMAECAAALMNRVRTINIMRFTTLDSEFEDETLPYQTLSLRIAAMFDKKFPYP